MARSKTYIATPPGATIKEQLEYRGMSQREFAKRMDYSEKFISQLINGQVELTPNTAHRLEMVLGVPSAFWMSLEARYREKLLQVEEENSIDEDIQIAKKFPYAQMARLGWVEPTRSAAEKVCELRKFFEVVRLSLLGEDRLAPGIAYRRQKETAESEYALLAWAQKAKIDARGITTGKINVGKLEESVSKLRELATMYPAEFQPILVSMLAECGIATVFLPHLEHTFLNGATFYDGPKIVLALTLRGADADKFWFSLFHELAHVIYGHIGRTAGTTEEEERSADAFARDTLIPPEAYAQFAAGSKTRSSVASFANEIGIAPGIVVGRLQKDGYLPYSQLNSLKVRYQFAE